MPLPRFINDAIGVNDYKEVTAPGTVLGVNETIVKATLTSAGTIYLPPVSQCKGKIVTVIATNGGTYTTTVAAKVDSYIALSVAIAVNNGYVVAFCDGRSWFNLVSVIA